MLRCNTCCLKSNNMAPSENQSRAALELQGLVQQSRELGLKLAIDIESLRNNIKQALEQFETNQLSTASLKGLMSSLSAVPAKAERQAQANNILASLWYDAFYARRSQIAEAQNKTFEWIFDKSHFQDGRRQRPKLNEWLKSQSGSFWISRKPGS